MDHLRVVLGVVLRPLHLLVEVGALHHGVAAFDLLLAVAGLARELVGLTISDVSVSAAMFKALARHCPKLQDLRVPSSAGVTAASVRALLACKSLRYLLLPGRKMGKAGAEDLKEALPELAVEWQDAPPDEE